MADNAMRIAAAGFGLAGSGAYAALYVWAAPGASGWHGHWKALAVLLILGGLWAAGVLGAVLAVKRPLLAAPLLAAAGAAGLAYYLYPAGLAMLVAFALCLWAARPAPPPSRQPGPDE